ncbi:MAG: AAA family ATPase [Oscillospiraceae bacterium]|nr:AAA family ATPase [Oscillospiraceae bacterium]
MLRRPIDKNSYLNNVPAVRYLMKKGTIELNKNITFLVGENGTGKSTLIEAIAIAYGFNPEGGTKNFCFETARAHSDLWEHLTVVKNRFAKDGFFLRAESFFNVATQIDELDSISTGLPSLIDSYGGISLHEQSHGESFLALVQNRFGGNGVYILDEPEAALSPMRLMTLIAEISALVRRDSQFIIATHSPILMAMPNSEILEITEDGIKSVGYKETEHYRITRRFLENPEKMLKYLTEE